VKNYQLVNKVNFNFVLKQKNALFGAFFYGRIKIKNYILKVINCEPVIDLDRTLILLFAVKILLLLKF